MWCSVLVPGLSFEVCAGGRIGIMLVYLREVFMFCAGVMGIYVLC